METIQKKLPISLAQVQHMLVMQDQLNCQAAGPEWRKENLNWKLAIISEVMELLDHKGWKWWKGKDSILTDEQCKGNKQLLLEVVDIFHFFLSVCMEQEATAEQFMQAVEEFMDFDTDMKGKEVAPLEQVLCHFVTRGADCEDFHFFLWKLDFTWQDLYKFYVAKNVLNRFRQDHGYKEGTYQKVIQGKEDNEILEGIVDQVHVEGEVLSTDRIYSMMQTYYEVHVPKGIH